MAGSSEIYVVFGGDSSALEASIASAKASVTQFQRELTSLARQQVATGASAESDLGQRMLAAAGRLSEARGAVSSLRTELGSVSGSAGGAAAGVEAVSHAASSGVEGVSFYVREVRALFDELSSGRDRQAVGTFSNLAGHFLAAHTAIIPMVAGIAAAGAALGYAAYQMFAFEKAVESVQMTAMVNQFAMARDASVGLVESIQQLANVSSSDAQAIANAFAPLQDAGPIIAKAVASDLPMLAKVLGKDVGEAAKDVAEKFTDLKGKGQQFVDQTNAMSTATKEQMRTLVEAGEAPKAMAILLQAVNMQYGAAREKLDLQTAAQTDATAAALANNTAIQAGGDALAAFASLERNAGEAVADATKKLDAETSVVNGAIAALNRMPAAAAAMTQALAEADKFDKVGASLRTVSAEMSGMQAALQSATASGDTAGVDRLTSGLARAGEEFKKLQQQSADGLLSRDATAQTEAALAHLDATWKGSTAGRLTAERDQWQQIVSGEKSTAEQVEHARAQVESKTKEINEAGTRDYEASVDRQVAAAGKSFAQVVSLRQAAVAREREAWGTGSDQEREALDKLARAQEQAANRGAAAAAKGAKDELGATEAGIKGQIKALEDSTNAYIAHLEAEVKLKQIGEGQKAALAIAALDKEKAAVDKLYQDEAALAGLSLTKKKEIGNQELAFNDAVSLKLQDAQVKAAEKTEQSWDATMKSINSAFDSQINGLLAGTTNWHTAFTNVLRDLSEQTIKFFVNWGLEQAENAAKGIALDNARVATHITGDAAITAADQSASSAGLVANIGNVLKSIAAFAGQVGAAVAAFLAPVLGPAAVPAGAAASAAVVAMGQGGIGAMDIGAYNVPENQLALIHKNELVMPAAQAGAFRNMLDGGGSSGGAGGGDMHFHFSPQVQAIDAAGVSGFLNNYARQFAQTVAGQFNSQPSLRPSY